MNTSPGLTRRSFLLTAAASLASPAFAARTRGFAVNARQVRGIAANCCGEIAVAADRALLIHDADGALVRSVPLLSPARSVAWNGSAWFVAMKNRVARIDDGGTVVLLGGEFGTRESAFTGLAVAESGEIFAADSGERVIWRLDAAGRVLGKIEGFTVPRAFFPIAWHEGKLHAAEPGRHQVRTFSREGEPLAHWGARSREVGGFAGCCNPVSVAVLDDGTVVTAERGQPRVKAFGAAGDFARILAGPEQFAASVVEDGDLFACEGGIIDVAAVPGGGVVVLDRATREVRVLA